MKTILKHFSRRQKNGHDDECKSSRIRTWTFTVYKIFYTDSRSLPEHLLSLFRMQPGVCQMHCLEEVVIDSASLLFLHSFEVLRHKQFTEHLRPASLHTDPGHFPVFLLHVFLYWQVYRKRKSHKFLFFYIAKQIADKNFTH